MTNRNPYIDDFILHINPKNLRVASYTNKIFFCGGPRTTPKEKQDIDKEFDKQPHENREYPPPKSARDFLLQKLLIKPKGVYERLYYEDFMDEWSQDGHFLDLVSFEKHVSEVSSAVLLIAESPGSFTELGMFVTQKQIIEKLLVIVSNELDNDGTFLSLGPLKFLRENNENTVRAYEWKSQFKTGNDPKIEKNDLDIIWEYMIEDLLSHEKSIRKNSAFNPEYDGHISLLILDLLNIFGALTLTELLDAISLHFDSFKQKDLKRHIFLLQKMELISIRTSGTKYFLTQSNKTHIHYGFEKQTNTDLSDRKRLMMKARDWFEKNDAARLRLITRHVGEVK